MKCNHSKYIYSRIVLKYNFEVLVLHLIISIFCYFILLLHFISEGNIVLFTPLLLFDSYSYELLFRVVFYIKLM